MLSTRTLIILWLVMNFVMFSGGNEFWQFNIIEILTFVGGIVLILGAWLYRKFCILRNTYKVMFLDNPENFPPAPATHEKYITKLTVNCDPDGKSTIFLCFRIKRGITLKTINVRLVNRQWFPPRWYLGHIWGWNPAQERFISVTAILDAKWQRAYQMYQVNQVIMPRPLEESDFVGGIDLTYMEPMTLLQGDWLWLRVYIQAHSCWQGHLEFRGPSIDKKRAFHRRTVKVRIPTKQAPDKEGSPTEQV